MSDFKATIAVVVVIMLTACSKQKTTPILGTANAETLNSDLRWQFPDRDNGSGTIFGLIQQPTFGQPVPLLIIQNKNDMNKAAVNLTRVSIALSETTVNKMIDEYLMDGYDVQIIVNWKGGVNGYRGFPKSWEMVSLKEKAEAFFQYYSAYKDQIPFVTIENEWDWEVVNGSNLQDYLEELAVITPIALKYGFKVADGGITSTALQRWTYSQLSGEQQDQWDEDYWVGLNSGYDYNDLMDIVNTFIEGAKDINFHYSNVHWSNISTCGDGFATASQIYMKACNKNSVVCNEFYIGTNSLDLFNSTVNEIEGNVKYAVAYSGINEEGAAIQFTDAMLEDLVK